MHLTPPTSPGTATPPVCMCLTWERCPLLQSIPLAYYTWLQAFWKLPNQVSAKGFWIDRRQGASCLHGCQTTRVRERTKLRQTLVSQCHQWACRSFSGHLCFEALPCCVHTGFYKIWLDWKHPLIKSTLKLAIWALLNSLQLGSSDNLSEEGGVLTLVKKLNYSYRSPVTDQI